MAASNPSAVVRRLQSSGNAMRHPRHDNRIELLSADQDKVTARRGAPLWQGTAPPAAGNDTGSGHPRESERRGRGH